MRVIEVAREEGGEPPIVFVYLGGQLPPYTKAALTFTAKNYSGDTVLVTDSSRDPVLGQLHGSKVQVVNSDGWYQRDRFNEFRRATTLDPSFRSGFWLHVVERFFVMHQFMIHFRKPRIFHAELDVMVFDLNGVSAALNAHGTGIFAVMDDHSRALASLFYVNSRNKFKHFLDFLASQVDMNNEMEAIGSYLQKFPSHGHSLPSDRFFDREAHPLSPSSVDSQIGLFDANAFGQWLFGLDPRNVKHLMLNHYRNPMARFPIERLRFQAPFFDHRVWVRMPLGERREVRTLHVHSKMLQLLSRRSLLRLYLWVNNIPGRVPVYYKPGTFSALLLSRMLRGRSLAVLKRLTRVAPRLFPGVLEALIVSSSIPLSIRERREAVALFSIRPQVNRDFVRKPSMRKDVGPQLDRPKKDFPAGASEVQHPNGLESRSGLSEVRVNLAHGSESEMLDYIWGADCPGIAVENGLATRVPTTGHITVFGRQDLFVGFHKLDELLPLLTEFLPGKLSLELGFDSRFQLFQPQWVRDIFGRDRNRAHAFLRAAEPGYRWYSLVQAYGVWARTFYRAKTRLRGLEEGTEV